MEKQTTPVTLGTLWQRFWSCVFVVLAMVLLAANLVKPDFTVQLGWPVFVYAAALLIWARLLWRPNSPD